MAAPIQACLSKLRRYTIILNLSRNYARKTKRSVQVMDPEADVYKIKHSIVDPRKNAYLPFDPNDPVQKSLLNRSSATVQRKESKVYESKNKHILTKTVRDGAGKGKVNIPPKTQKDQQPRSQQENQKLYTWKGKDQKAMISYEKLAETDYRFGYKFQFSHLYNQVC